jgi:hypothetical protein
MEREILFCDSEVIILKHKTNPRQKPRSRLFETYINRICVLEIKVLFAQNKKGAGEILPGWGLLLGPRRAGTRKSERRFLV